LKTIGEKRLFPPFKFVVAAGRRLLVNTNRVINQSINQERFKFVVVAGAASDFRVMDSYLAYRSRDRSLCPNTAISNINHSSAFSMLESLT